MYKIVDGATMVGIVVQPTYVKMLDNDCYGLCKADEASGIVFDGTVYPLAEITLEQTYEPAVSGEYIAMQDALIELGVLPLEEVQADE